MKPEDVVGKFVKIKWKDPDNDWPFFQVLELSKGGKRIKLRGMPFPDGTGIHVGDEFWIKVSEVENLSVVILIGGKAP